MASHRITFHGILKITLAGNGLEARLSFEPGDTAEDIDIAGLTLLLLKNNVREGILTRNLETALEHLGKSPGPFSIPVARGVPPLPPVPEKPLWESLPVPAELEADARQIFPRAGNPSITVERTERVKTERIILKKSPLPFAPPKKVRMEVEEKRTVREKVEVDPGIEGTGYITEGARAARIEPFTAGKPGKSVTGAMIPPEKLREPHVYAGEGLVRKNGAIFAVRTGFIRWGRNWAEILPFQSHRWRLSLSSDKASCLLDLTPGNPGSRVPPGDEIRAAAHALPYDPMFLLSSGEIDDIVHGIISAGKPVQDVPVSISRDAAIRIRISDDRLKAFLDLRKGRGSGRPLSLREVGAAIRESGLVGMDLVRIKTDITEFHRSGSGELEDYILAEGREPTRGTGGETVWDVDFLPGKTLTELKQAAERRPGGLSGLDSVLSFPVEAAEAAAHVEANRRVLSLNPGADGIPGRDVFGAAIPPLEGGETSLILRENLGRRGNLVVTLARGILEKRSVPEGLEIRVRPHRDGEVKISLALDRMAGYITLIPSEGTGVPPDAGMIARAAARAGVVRGIRQEILDAALEKVLRGEPITRLLFARGQAPRRGEPRKISYLVQIASDRQVNIRSDGSADYKNREANTSVEEGEAVAEILPPEVTPMDGWDIAGRIFPAEDGSEGEITAGGNIRTEIRDGRTFLVAAKSGELVLEENSVGIRDGRVVKGDVSLKTGNIRFPGPVSVTGSVASGFFIVAGGDIRIAGGIDAALLSAEGSISIQQGIKGAGRAVLRSRGSVTASFAEQAVILSVGDTRIKNGCLRCRIRCNGKLELASEKGSIIGGVVKARRGIDAASLGTERGVRTEISFGQDYLIADRIETHDGEIKKLKLESVKIDSMMRESEKQGDRRKLESLRVEKLGKLKRLDKLTHSLFFLREKFEEHSPGEIRIRGTVYPGVVIESHGRYHEITEPQKGMRIFFEPKTGRIQEEKL